MLLRSGVAALEIIFNFEGRTRDHEATVVIWSAWMVLRPGCCPERDPEGAVDDELIYREISTSLRALSDRRHDLASKRDERMHRSVKRLSKSQQKEIVDGPCLFFVVNT